MSNMTSKLWAGLTGWQIVPFTDLGSLVQEGEGGEGG